MSQKNLKIYNSIWVISKENHHKLKFLPNKPKVHFRLTSFVLPVLISTLEIMKTLPEYRTDDEIEIIVRGMQALDEFTYYQPEVQRKMARYLFYEEYEANRIIFKEGNLADFMYFVVKGACKFSAVGFKTISQKCKNIKFWKNIHSVSKITPTHQILASQV